MNPFYIFFPLGFSVFLAKWPSSRIMFAIRRVLETSVNIVSRFIPTPPFFNYFLFAPFHLYFVELDFLTRATPPVLLFFFICVCVCTATVGVECFPGWSALFSEIIWTLQGFLFERVAVHCRRQPAAYKPVLLLCVFFGPYSLKNDIKLSFC